MENFLDNRFSIPVERRAAAEKSNLEGKQIIKSGPSDQQFGKQRNKPVNQCERSIDAINVLL